MDDTLCQSEHMSCIGCCYDVRAYKKEDLVRFFRQTRNFYKDFVERRNDIEGYEAAVKEFKIEKVRDVFTWDKNCHFVGFLDDKESHAGCLAHPKTNYGRDLKDKGRHKSADLCGKWSCWQQKIYTRLNPEQKKIFRDKISCYTWYEPMNTDNVIDLLIDLFGDKKETRLNNVSILLGELPFHGW